MNSFRFFGLIVSLIVVTAVVPPPVFAAACVSNGTGLWSDPATWIACNNMTPQPGDTAQIQNGHIVTLDTGISNVSISIDSGGVLDTFGSFDWGGSPVIVNGTLRLNGGDMIQNAGFTYNSGSTLNYNGGTYNRGPEWSSGTPHHIQLSNNTIFDLATIVPQTIVGDLLIDTGTTFLMGNTDADLIVQGSVDIQGILELATGTGNIQVGGDWQKAPTTMTDPYKFKHNNSWVIFNGGATQAIIGDMNGPKDRFDRIIVTNNSEVVHHNNLGIVTGLEVAAGSSFRPATNQNFEQELNSPGILTCIGTCSFNRLIVQNLNASGSTGVVDVNENFVVWSQASSFIAPPNGAMFTIAGNLRSDGTIDYNGGTVQFDGGTTQTMSGVGFNAFHNLVVASGTTLVDTANTAVTAAGIFTNNGVFRRAEILSAPGIQDFGLTNVTMEVNSLSNFLLITVDRIDSDHIGATADIAANSDRHWIITNNTPGIAFDLDLIFNDETLLSNSGQQTCRTADGGANWDCVPDSAPEAAITRRNGVTTFSDWQNCAACGPTAISLTDLRLSPHSGMKWMFLSLMVVLALMTIYFQYRRGAIT